MKTLTITMALLIAACAAPTRAPNELAPSGTLRVAINYGNPVLATKDERGGELHGVAVDVGRELARRAALPVALVAYPTVAKLMSGLAANEWDVAFLAIDPARAREVAFTAAYMEVEVTYLVPAQSALRDVADVDRAGVRVAVEQRNAADLFLSQNLRQASLVRVPGEPRAFDLLKTGAADAFASNKQRLLPVAESDTAYRVLDGRFTTIPHAVGVPAPRNAALASVRDLIEDLKTSGFVASAIERAGVRGVVVAPPAR